METKHYQTLPLARFFLSALMLIFLFAPFPAEAADPGSLKGKITDKTDDEAVIGASVMLENTTLGAASDIEGNYMIQNIPAGTYQLKVNALGYAPFFQTITINPGQTTTLNPQLDQTTVMASEIIVGAALYKQDRLEVPVTVSIVTDEEIKEEPNPSLDEVIEDVPGVNVNRSAGYGTSTVQIRGSNTFQGGAIGTRVQGLYDGFPLNTPTTGEVVWSNVNMNAADKVEVLKGAAATLYGSGAMGGVVNVFGSLPEKFEVTAGASGGFYDGTPDSDKSEYRKNFTPWLWSSYVGIGNKTDKLNYSLIYSHGEDDGYRENTWSSLDDVKLKARYDINSDQYIQLTSFYNETRGGYPSTWPYTADIDFMFLLPTYEDVDVGVTFNPLTQFAYDAVDSVYVDDTIKRKNALVGLNYVNLLSDDLSLDARLYYTYNRTRIDYNPTDVPQIFGFDYLTYFENPVPGDDPIPGFPAFLAIYDRDPGEFNETKSNRYGAGFKLDWRASDKHRLLFGVDGNIVDVQSTQYVADLPEEGQLGDTQEKNIAFFLQDEFKMTDRLTALFSVRYDWSGIDADNVTYLDYEAVLDSPLYPAGAPEETAKIEHPSVDAISPRIALNYKATDDMSFRASWGKSFRAPTLAERFVRDAGLFLGIPNPEINKETMTAYEIGMFKQFSDKVSFDLAAYINDYDNLIESRNLNPNYWPILFQYQNVAKARIWGIETSLNVQPNPDWNLIFAYAYMNAKDKGDEGSSLAGELNPDPDWLAYRPEHTASINAMWQATGRLNLFTKGRYVSKYKAVSSYPNPDGDNYPGGFIVFDAGVKYKLTDNLTGSFLCKNITNEQYEEAEWFRSPNRSFIVGLDFVY
ncbi:MAG: TonB-dependent receptor [Chlorobiales bacterium]|nr:TonB-dependent receptor [Chlorobiales bacterium]